MSISHVNGISAASLSAVLGVSKANINAINGVTASFGGSVTPVTNSLAICGCECRVTGVHWTLGTGMTFDTSLKRSGSASINITRSGATWGYTAVGTPSGNVSNYSFYIYFTTLPSVDQYIFGGGSGAARIGLTWRSATSKIHCGAGTGAGSAVGSGITLTTGQWYLIDVKIDQTTSAKTCDAYIDGVALTQATNSSATAGTAPAFNNGGISTTVNFNIDDYVALDGGTNFPIGTHSCDAYVPTADGTHSISTANTFERTGTGTDITNATTDAYQLVDELPTTTSDYVRMSTTTPAGDYVETLFGPGPGFSAASVAPSAMDVVAIWSGGGGASTNRRIAVNDNGTLSDVVNSTTAQSTTAVTTKVTIAGPPSGAAGWSLSGTNGNFNNLRARFLTSSSPPADAQRWHAIFAEVLFR